MKFDAPQLTNSDHSISLDGEVCQFRFENKSGDSLSFTMPIQQLAHFVDFLREVEKEMHIRVAG
jgi:hypothetical protein